MTALEQLTDEEVVALLAALQEAARASQATVERFVTPRLGIVEEATAGAHQFVLGRRGVGKSTLLRKVEQLRRESGGAVVFLDLETLRGVPYPDVLIRLLSTLLSVLGAELRRQRPRGGPRAQLRQMRLHRDIQRLRRDLETLLEEPQAAEHTVRRLRSRRRQRGFAGDISIAGAAQRLRFGLNAKLSDRRDHVEDQALEARFVRTKMDGLYSAAPLIRGVLERTTVALAGPPSLLILDDFYHVATDDQPRVLAYLHQVVKNLNIFLKVSAVRHRLNPFEESDPPVGLQPGHDANELSLDLTLGQFAAARTFLEHVLDGICAPLGIPVDKAVAEGARTRLVLGSGGVARDYLNLARMALRRASERPHRTYLPKNRITVEDVNEASAELQTQKQDDLRHDSGESAERLRARLSDLARFCLDYNGANVFLVEATHLHETAWGNEIEALADLRFIHEVGNISVRSSDFRGKRFVAFTLDLSNYTGTRSERINQIEFWKTEGKSQLRRVGLIYEPEFETTRALTTVESTTPVPRVPVDWTQPPLPGMEEDEEA